MGSSFDPFVVDIETRSADERYTADPREFIRLTGIAKLAADGGSGDVVTSASPAAPKIVADLLAPDADGVAVGHNVLAFDLPAINRAEGGVDILKLTQQNRVIDTYVLAQLRWPGEEWEGTKQIQRRLGLDAVAEKLGVAGKSDSLVDLALEWDDLPRDEKGKPLASRAQRIADGLGRIPLTDQRYHAYLRGDLEASRVVANELAGDWAADPYYQREHRVYAIFSTVTDNGFRVDETFARAKYQEGLELKADRALKLSERYGVPLTDAKGKPRKSPHATKEGKAALLQAFAEHGVPESDLPRTRPSNTHPEGQVSFSGNEIRAAVASKGHDTESGELGELITFIEEMTGVRTVYGTALDNMYPDGFVHPEISSLQVSGRMSMTNPGITVMGKRNGKYHERAVYLPDNEDEVLVAFDLDQVDARCVAAHSQDTEYMKLFGIDPKTKKPVDMHMEFARKIWGPDVPYEKRDLVKPMSHGSNYGMGTRKLAESAGVSLETAEAFAQMLQESYPLLHAWKMEIRQYGEYYGYVDNGWGRRMKVNRERAWTQAPALVGQGCTRDVLLHGVLRMPHEIIRMIKAFVHDEIVFSIPREHLAEISEVIMDAMTFEWAPPGKSIPVQFTAGMSKPGRNWAECYQKD